MKKKRKNIPLSILQLPKKQKRHYSVREIIAKTLFRIFLIVLCIIFLFPVVWMLSNSFKTQAEVYASINSIKTFLPATWNISKWFLSYQNLFATFDNFGRSILNSVIYATISITGVLLVNSLAGYALSRFVFPGHKTIVSIIILILIVPVETSIVPLYVILKNLGLLTAELRVIGYLLPGIVSPFYIFMFRAFFLGIPKELEEAAYVDGASKLTTFFKVIVPLSLPVFATVAIFTFMGSWNEYVFAQLMFSNPVQQPLQVFLQLINNFNPKDISLVMASLTFSTIPIALVYIFAQRYIIEGVAFTGLK
ncbi:MAG: carbohydrate ABC transporter permease [Bacilli bacterium]